MKSKFLVAALLSVNAVVLNTPNKDSNLVAEKSNDISENQKKLFAHMQKKAGSEIQIFDMNHINDPDWRENLPDMRLAMNQQDINLK